MRNCLRITRPLVILLLLTSQILLGQKQLPWVTDEEMCEMLTTTFERFHKSHKVKWVYFQLASHDTTSYSVDFPPPPPFLGNCGYSEFDK